MLFKIINLFILYLNGALKQTNVFPLRRNGVLKKSKVNKTSTMKQTCFMSTASWECMCLITQCTSASYLFISFLNCNLQCCHGSQPLECAFICQT